MENGIAGGRIDVTVDLLVISVDEGRLRIFLSKRVKPPYEGLWALPGAFVKVDESAESAAQRLLKEMLPGVDVYLEQLYTFSGVNRDPRGRVISIGYLAIVPSGRLESIHPGTQLQLFDAGVSGDGPVLQSEGGSCPSHGDLAFDHEEIIRMGIFRLQGKVEYTGIGFRFLKDPQCFSLGELQSVHEAILGKVLDASNFRRWISNRYEKTGRIIRKQGTGRSGRGRPSGLYRLAD